MEPNVRARIKLSPEQRCGFCRDQLHGAEDAINCPSCGAGFHEDCFRIELGGHCVTIGCSTYKAPLRRRGARLRARLRERRRRAFEDPGWKKRLFITLGATLVAGVLVTSWIVLGGPMELLCVLLVPFLVLPVLLKKRRPV